MKNKLHVEGQYLSCFHYSLLGIQSASMLGQDSRIYGKDHPERISEELAKQHDNMEQNVINRSGHEEREF